MQAQWSPEREKVTVRSVFALRDSPPFAFDYKGYIIAGVFNEDSQ